MKELYSSPSVKCIRMETEHLLDGGSAVHGGGSGRDHAKQNLFFQEDDKSSVLSDDKNATSNY